MTDKKTIPDETNRDNSIQFPHIPKQTEGLARITLNSAFQVHTTLGPGLLESVYEECMIHELNSRNVKVVSQIAIPVIYKGVKIESGFRLDLLVGDEVIVEIKSSEGINPVHCAQLLTYLKLTGKRLGLLINFNVIHLRDGIKRIIN
ncbi:MAG: GxxExxY protein [Acidobacteriaceae bacterium]